MTMEQIIELPTNKFCALTFEELTKHCAKYLHITKPDPEQAKKNTAEYKASGGGNKNRQKEIQRKKAEEIAKTLGINMYATSVEEMNLPGIK